MAKRWWWSRINEDEYRANLAGMNTFFGAVLGFVLADVQTDSMFRFANVLIVTAGTVISILYISASPKRWWYALLTFFFIWFLPRLLREEAGDLGRLQVTLAVWTGMTLFVEALWALQKRGEAKDIVPEP
jgi:hypothetical protein